MDSLDTTHYLNELWDLHNSRGDQASLMQYLEEFTGVYRELLKLDIQDAQSKESSYGSSCYSVLENGTIALDHLPPSLLQIILNRVMTLQDRGSDLSVADVRLASYVVQAMTVISRTNNSTFYSLSSSLVGYTITITSQVISMLGNEKSINARDYSNLEAFVQSTLHLIERLYDPELLWRKKIQGIDLKSTSSRNVALINAEVIPFFYETLQMHARVLSGQTQQHLLNMFGSILCGSQRNALLAASSTTLEILLKFLSQYMGLGEDSQGPAGDSDSRVEKVGEKDIESSRLVLRLIIKMVHVLHNSSPDQCQLDVKKVLGEYFKLLSKASNNPDMQVQMISFIPDILHTRDRQALQIMLLQHGCLSHLKEVLKNFRARSSESATEASDLFAVQFVKIVSSLVAGSMSAKEQFSRHLGASFVLDHFKVICIPSREVVTALMNMSVEDDDVLSQPRPIKNIYIVLMLFDWLPNIKQSEQQIWLSSILLNLFTSCAANKILACHCKIVTRIIASLIESPNLHQQTVLNLITLIEKLGSFSLTPRQTLAFFELLRQDSSSHQHLNKYFDRILNSLYVMAHKEVHDRKPAYFFDLHDETSGITVPTMKKWGGNGFSIHTWVCLEHFPYNEGMRKRRQLYSFSTDGGTGLEAFFTAECQLVVAVSTKKNYYTVMLNEYPLIDNKWHCIQIIHHPARKVFGFNGVLTITIDGVQRLSTSIRFPSVSSFTLSHIGSSGHRTNVTATDVTQGHSMNENNSSNSDRVVSIDSGCQDDVWGQATSLLGQLGSVVVFNEALKDPQMTMLYNAGLDMWKNSRAAESPFEDIPVSKIVLYYEAKACYKHVCKDLSLNDTPRDGRLTGHKIYTWDIKDSINCIGGMAVMTPLLEVIHARSNNKSESVVEFEDMNSGSSINEYRTKHTSRSTSFVRKNPVANFINVLSSFLTSSNSCSGWHFTNADVMVKCGSFATIGALLEKMSPALLDENLVRSIEILVRSVQIAQDNGGTLLTDIYQYILFDFRIWCLASPAIQYSHVQHVSTLIKDNKKNFRSTFGVQYMLDVIKTYFSSSRPELSENDARNIRCSLLGLVKFYVTDDVTIDELDALLNFMSAADEDSETQICEILNLLKSLVTCKCREQLGGLLSEAKFCNWFYSVIGLHDISNVVKAAICEFLIALFKLPRVMEKHRTTLRQASVGVHGILWQVKDAHLHPPLCELMVNLITQIECDAALLLATMRVVALSSVKIKRSACQHFLTLAYSKASFLADCAKQPAWQEALSRLFVDASKSKDHRNMLKSQDRTMSTIEASNIEAAGGLNGGKWNDHVTNSFPVSPHGDPRTPSPFDDSAAFSNGLDMSHNDKDFVIVKPADVKIDGDLMDLAVESTFLIMWRGVTGASSPSWLERSMIFSALDEAAKDYELIDDVGRIKARILECCIEAALSDVRESSATSGTVKSTGINFAIATENSERLVRTIYSFLLGQEQNRPELWTETLMQNLFALYDALLVWGQTSFIARGNEWHELADIGLGLLLGCIATGKLEMVAMSSAKLHNLIHSREPSSTEEVCYLLEALHTFVCSSIEDKSDVKEFVVPLIRDMLDKNFERLNMSPHLSELPPTSGSPKFFEDFLDYCVSKEWKSFIATCVVSNCETFKRKTLTEVMTSMNAFWESAADELKVSYHKSARERGEVKLRFKAEFESEFYSRRQSEDDRQSRNTKSLNNQNVSVLRQWRAAKRFLASERGLWRDRNPAKTYWKLSNAENFSRMRLKLTENYNFDLHEDSSRLRDNLAPTDVKDVTKQEALVPANAVLPSNDTNKEDDSVGDEDWSLLASNVNVSVDEQSTKEKLVLSEDCQLVTLMDVVTGKMEVTTTHVYFYDKSTNNDETPEPGLDFKWSLSQLREVHLRRYNLRKSALELFLIDQTNYFINFNTATERHNVYKALLSVRPPNLLYYGMRTPQELLKASDLTQKWCQREISNFDYLMQLNTIAGRTYNDLSQYPVFPWVLKDYKSERLDLDDPEVYRDFSKPVGILNPNNEQEIREKYDHFEDPLGVIKKFHYGSHYSNAASVLFFMLRMEPFTTLHIQLQAGRFDLADRQFQSISGTFQTMLDTTNDVKELIPEFFYMPEFLVNSNGFDLGRNQFSKEIVNDVILPTWAKNPEDFVHQHRKALESEHVSNNLHHWIDLIFGYKQRGEEAVNACNVFYYCTYEGAVDLDAIEDPIHRQAVEGMINNFGQTPTQLLREPHPRRMTPDEAARKVASGRIMSTLNIDVKTPNVLEQPEQLKTFFVEIMANGDPLAFVTVPRSQSHSFMQSGMPDTMVTVSEGSVIGLHGWLPYDRNITNYFTMEKDPAVDHVKLRRTIKGLLSPGLHLSPNLFLVTQDAKFLFVGGYWDNSIRVMTLRGKIITTLVRHLDVVTCLALDHTGSYVISGSYDTTCIVWKINQHAGNISAQPLHVLHGHEDVVTCVVINTELDIALSSSKDGTCIVHTVHKGNYVRTIRPLSTHPKSFNVPAIALSEEGKIVLYARSKKEAGEEKHFLHLYSINGRHLALDCLEARLGHMAIYGEHLVTGDIHGVLIVRELFSFNEISRLMLYRPITCVFVTKGMSHILACLRDGKLIIVGVDRPAKARGLFAS